jgi:Kef-type K+ transport system membrane component KefB
VDSVALTFTTLGALLLAALAGDWLGRHTPLPRVSVLLLLGVVAGPAVLDLLPEARAQWETIATDLALAMVGFVLGRDFDRDRVRALGVQVFVVAAVGAVVAAAVVAAGLVLVGVEVQVALALGGIASATAPAATLVVVRDLRAEGPVTRALTAIVAIDDAIAIAVFTVLLAVGTALGGGLAPADLALDAVADIGGAVLLGVVLGLPAALLTRRLRDGEPTLLESSAIVLLIVGLATWLDVSLVLAAVTVGVVVTNIDRGDLRPFRAVERVEWPFLAVFFLLGGAALEWEALREEAALIGTYVALRTAGKLVGAVAGATAARTSPTVRRWLGATLLPQAGVGLGLALQVREQLPEVAQTVVPVVVVSTVVFELLGPLGTRLGLQRAGETGKAADQDESDKASAG